MAESLEEEVVRLRRELEDARTEIERHRLVAAKVVQDEVLGLPAKRKRFLDLGDCIVELSQSKLQRRDLPAIHRYLCREFQEARWALSQLAADFPHEQLLTDAEQRLIGQRSDSGEAFCAIEKELLRWRANFRPPETPPLQYEEMGPIDPYTLDLLKYATYVQRMFRPTESGVFRREWFNEPYSRWRQSLDGNLYNRDALDERVDARVREIEQRITQEHSTSVRGVLGAPKTIGSRSEHLLSFRDQKQMVSFSIFETIGTTVLQEEVDAAKAEFDPSQSAEIGEDGLTPAERQQIADDAADVTALAFFVAKAVKPG
jgi:hypothetical protein